MLLAKKHLACFIFISSVSPAPAFALTCKNQSDGSAVIRESLNTELAIPADAPDGTIIWESEEYTANVKCMDEWNSSTAENIYLYTNPAKVNIGSGIRIGMRYKGASYTQSNTKVETGYNAWYGCTSIWSCSGWWAKFPLKFTIFIEKFGPTPSSGKAIQLNEYRVFQLDGKNGLNNKPDSNVNYIISGLGNIRFIPCSPELTIIPSVINFRRALSSTAVTGQVASSANFKLDLLKTCDTPYTVNARFRPVTGSVINNLLVPSNNNSVGISLVREENNFPVPYNSWFKLASLTGSGQSRIDFRADLIWRGKPIMGEFKAEAQIDMYYQ